MFFDVDDGDMIFGISDDMGMDSDGNMMMRVGDNMAMDMDSGELHFGNRSTTTPSPITQALGKTPRA